MDAQRVKVDFKSNEFYDRLLALRAVDPKGFNRLGAVTLATLRAYEAARNAARDSRAPSAVTEERRAAERIYIRLPARCESERGSFDATISDISTGGCFVLSPSELSPREILKISVLLPRAGWVSLYGAVVNAYEGVGFAARFGDLTEAELAAIDLLSSIVKKRATRNLELETRPAPEAGVAEPPAVE